MSERPILFSGSMVRAILEGRKTQTRRVVNPQPPERLWSIWQLHPNQRPTPYGEAGSRLWVRETRWASRITLEITDIRVERVQDISEKDAYAEGCNDVGHPYLSAFGGRAVINNFISLWDSIYGKRPGRSWSDNPWVWCLSFRRIEQASSPLLGDQEQTESKELTA